MEFGGGFYFLFLHEETQCQISIMSSSNVNFTQQAKGQAVYSKFDMTWPPKIPNASQICA